jgi:hypothetical protein
MTATETMLTRTTPLISFGFEALKTVALFSGAGLVVSLLLTTYGIVISSDPF